MVEVLIFRVDIAAMTFEVMTPQCWMSVVQLMVVRVDIGMVTYKAI